MPRVTASGFELADGPVLVTGAAGFVARFLMEELRMGPGDIATDMTTDFTVPDGVTRVAWTLPSPPPVDLADVAFVVHLAAMTSVARSHGAALDYYHANAMGTVSLVDSLLEASSAARLLFVSSADVYGSVEGAIRESCPPNPASPYAGSKAAAEIAVLQAHRSAGLDAVIARPFPHFGPGQAPHFALPSFCRRVIEAAAAGAGSVKGGNLSAVRDYTYVSDVASAYSAILAAGASGEVYNVASGRGRTMGEVLEAVIGISGVRLEIETDPGLMRQADIASQVGDPSRLAELGWRPVVDFHEGLSRLYDWWRRSR
ncbi:NAD-dependent epimerase/dehydratase family protein [Candidatus Fermentibacteria bacterium]|nr:NAD-dependent epimerase/dehydratase family protein [Candidatus Fermentibacteria bacterium]